VGSFVFAACTFLGYAGSLFATGNSRFIILWPISMLTHLRMWWTGPIGLVAILFLVIKDKSMQPRRSAIVNTIVFFAALATLALCFYLMVFKMYEVRM
jgi:hypothetical protein